MIGAQNSVLTMSFADLTKKSKAWLKLDYSWTKNKESRIVTPFGSDLIY